MEILCFLKFGKKEHLLSIKEKGEIFMNFYEMFKRKDENKERFDNLEGVKKIYHLTNEKLYLKLNKDEAWKSLKITKASYNEFLNSKGLCLYSLYFISIDELKKEKEIRIDDRMKEFGEYFLFIRSPRKLINGINDYLEKNKFEFSHQFISYYNEIINQDDLTLFHKKEELKHQKEYRFIVKAKTNENLKFQIGSLNDYCELYETKSLSDFIIKI